jgi:hypothetical protein
MLYLRLWDQKMQKNPKVAEIDLGGRKSVNYGRYQLVGRYGTVQPIPGMIRAQTDQ